MGKSKKPGEIQNNVQQRSKPAKKKSSETNGVVHNTVVTKTKMLPQVYSATKTLTPKQERESLVLWRHPFTTLHYFVRETLLDIKEYGFKILQYKRTTTSFLLFVTLATALYHLEGPHQNLVQSAETKVLWCLYWMGLGFLSSAGFGFGLHTFLLYLGPHIAKVTMAAYECGTLNFPEPPYPDDIICPDDNGVDKLAISIWSIMSKVRLEAMMWGAGTAIGELPPYFFALAKRLSGEELEDEEELEEFTNLQKKISRHERLSFYEKMKLTVERFVERVGFFGILACASIPNPLFDLAGITCGLCLVPFWTFFGATLIGKAIIKTHIQQAFVIIAFSETLVETVLALVGQVPYLGPKMQEPFKEFLAKQRAKMHGGAKVAEQKSLLGMVFEGLFIVMIIYFVVSIVNSLAQAYHKRIHTKKSKRRTKKQKV